MHLYPRPPAFHLLCGVADNPSLSFVTAEVWNGWLLGYCSVGLSFDTALQEGAMLKKNSLLHW